MYCHVIKAFAQSTAFVRMFSGGNVQLYEFTGDVCMQAVKRTHVKMFKIAIFTQKIFHFVTVLFEKLPASGEIN